MASKEFSLGGYMRARLETWEDGVNNSNNTSVVHARIKVWRSNTWSGQTYSSSVRREIWIDGSCVCDWTGELSHYKSYGEIEVASGQRTITHNADGKKTVGVQAYLTDNVGSQFTGSGSLDMVLTAIPRAAKITSAVNFTDEGNPVLNYSNPAGNAMGSLQACISFDGSVDNIPYRNISKTGTSYTFNLTEAERNTLRAGTPNSKTRTVYYFLRSVLGGNDWRPSLAKTLTIVNADPTFSDFTFADTNSTTTAITGNDQVMISGKSTLTVTIPAANKATANKSATMKKYTYQAAGLTGEDTYSTSDITKTLGTPTVAADELPSGTRDIVVTAIDSRGYQKAATKQVTIVPYSAPKINATATRASGFENATTVNISGSFSRIEVGGTAKNTVNTSNGVQYRYRQQGSSTWGSWTNRTATIDAATGKVTTAAFTLNLDNQAAFEFEFRITDKLETTTVSLTVSVGQPVFWIGDDGRVAVGGMPTASKATGEAGLLQVMGKVLATNIYPVGSIYMSTTMTTASQVSTALGGTWVAWGGGRVPVGMGSNGTTNYTTVEATGGEEKHKLTINEMPSHNHTIVPKADYNGSLSARHTTGWEKCNDTSQVTSNTGGGAAHENRQPYITVYMYKRTA